MAALADRSAAREEARQSSLGKLALGALGIVFGDIGTSPLYTIKEAFGVAGGLTPNGDTVLGVLSLVFWSLVLVVTVKYVWLIMRADNRHEGGVLALTSLALRAAVASRRLQRVTVALSIAGLSMFYGDGLITPAISVLSAVEGLEVAAPVLGPYVVPISLVVLVALFLVQQFGTGRVGSIFGPVMLVWFTVLAVLGLIQIVHNPAVLYALDPRWGARLFMHQGGLAFVALGAIVLAVTGAEALYADMGHFGALPIRASWLSLVFPALVLNYYGQGALILADPQSISNPFYHLAPTELQIPLVCLATLATIIASQAVISGVFSLTRQAIQLGYLPRMTVRHTSATEQGQIYIPRMNWLLLVGVVGLVLGFRSSSNLAAAYGITVTGAMAVDAILASVVAARLWRWGKLPAGLLFGVLLCLDLTYFSANTLKIPSGGWFPLVVAAFAAFIIVTWRQGRRVLWNRLYAQALPVSSFLDKMNGSAQRVAGTAVFMTGNPDVIPNALLHNLKHNKVLHERVLLMRVDTMDEPSVRDVDRISVDRLGKGFFKLEVRYGFMDQPDIPRALEMCREHGLAIDPMLTSFFLGRETLIASDNPEMGPVRERVFIFLQGIAVAATAYFGIPADRVVELGTQVEI